MFQFPQTPCMELFTYIHHTFTPETTPCMYTVYMIYIECLVLLWYPVQEFLAVALQLGSKRWERFRRLG